ncbi:hypothetical protein GCK72_016128 [Caenorhabditis remanei]|uniref:Uncharacterized protein n=1 Tax=Caenorhabditis remanei TaxID=31234 RepID=A0A6A5GY87_CAERE|nr:hypothetical protein GCK72_016128 [Caenorhabditis remanei]KAF1759661.1 hypothetical protein GCK72_016128 [Caenorhabditis remanei]
MQPLHPTATWLTTNASGILDWATAGHRTDRNNYCVVGNRDEKIIHVAYHIDLGQQSQKLEQVEHLSVAGNNPQNRCVNQNSRIVYCYPSCANTTLQGLVIDSAIKSNEATTVALDIQKSTHLDWAITVMQVDYNDPHTRINASVFVGPNSWCSVYIGVKPKLGFDWLYEIQLAKILP